MIAPSAGGLPPLTPMIYRRWAVLRPGKSNKEKKRVVQRVSLPTSDDWGRKKKTGLHYRHPPGDAAGVLLTI